MKVMFVSIAQNVNGCFRRMPACTKHSPKWAMAFLQKKKVKIIYFGLCDSTKVPSLWAILTQNHGFEVVSAILGYIIFQPWCSTKSQKYTYFGLCHLLDESTYFVVV